MDHIKSDNRFSYVLKDPRFRNIPKYERKFKIDKRFKGMFKDKRFKLKSTIDKRGRPINYSTTEDLKKYYELSSEVDSPNSDEEPTTNIKKKLKTAAYGDCGQNAIEETPTRKSDRNKWPHKKSLSEEVTTGGRNPVLFSENKGARLIIESSESGNEHDDGKECGEEGNVDFARGEGNLESSDTDEEDSSEESEEEGVSHPWGELIHDAPETKEITHRLAVCNMDWDRIKAQDLFTLLHSFKPPDGVIKHVKIYQSDFGKQRLQEEDLKAPAELVDETVSDGEQDGVEGSKFHMEKLRRYQLNRLRYYYAVVVCDSPGTANKIYEECDGVEYESSATRMDLRFIPNEMMFNEEPVSTSDALPDLSVYSPNLFVTAALQQAKVNLTWDETDPDRIKATQRAFDKSELEKMDLSAYIASSSSENEAETEDRKQVQNNFNKIDDENDDVRISKYRTLLQSIESEESRVKEDDVQLEITWEPGLRDTTEELVKQKQHEAETLTPWEQYLQKRREKKQKKRDEKKRSQEEKSSKQFLENPYSDDELPSDVDLQDPYFQEELRNEFKTKTKKKKSDKLAPPAVNEQEKAALELLLMEDGDHTKHHFNLNSMLYNDDTKIKKRKKKKKGEVEPNLSTQEDNFEVNLEDNRFSALYTSHLYNVDPSDPQFQKTKGMQKIVEEKLRRRAAGIVKESPSGFVKKVRMEEKSSSNVISPSDRVELSMLVKSIKNKTQNFKRRKEK